MGRDDVLEAEVFAHGFFEVVEVAAAGIGFVTNHQACPLVVTHCVGAAVGQEVDVNIFGIQQERVVTRFLHVFLALFAVGHRNRFNGFDFERFCRVFFRIVVTHGQAPVRIKKNHIMTVSCGITSPVAGQIS